MMRPGGPLPTTAAELDGVTKAAILMLSVSKEAAERMLRELSTEMGEEVMRVLASLHEVPPALTEQVVEEFYAMRLAAMGGREGGFDYAKQLVRGALDPKSADRIISQMETQVQKSPFRFLQRAESENLLTFIQDEHPQTIALILSHLPHHKASEILAGLPEQKQIEVVRRVANMEQTNPDVIRVVEKALEARLSSMLSHSTEKVGGVETVAEILNLCDRSTERTILDSVETEDPDLVEQIRRLMFVFEDILLVNDRGIQAVLKEIDNDELMLALRTASPDLFQKIRNNMSKRAGDQLEEDLQYMGPVRLADVESAQQRIVDVVRRLEEAGEIYISGRGGEQEIVV